MTHYIYTRHANELLIDIDNPWYAKRFKENFPRLFPKQKLPTLYTSFTEDGINKKTGREEYHRQVFLSLTTKISDEVALEVQCWLGDDNYRVALSALRLVRSCPYPILLVSPHPHISSRHPDKVCNCEDHHRCATVEDIRLGMELPGPKSYKLKLV